MLRFDRNFRLREDELKHVLFSRVSKGEMRKAEAILRWIEWHGMLRCGEIIRFACEMNGRDYDLCEDVYVIEREDGTKYNMTTDPRNRDRGQVVVVDGRVYWLTQKRMYLLGKLIKYRPEGGRRINRGYYCTPLFGSWKKTGLLEKNCDKRTYGSYSYYVVKESVVGSSYECPLYEDRKGSWA